MSDLAQIGMIGLGVMGANVARNFANNGFKTVVYNRDLKVAEDFMKNHGNENLIMAKSLEDFVQKLERPRKAMMLITAGNPVDQVTDALLELLEEGDLIIDGGNSNFKDTIRREEKCAARGIHFVGMGVSGGEEGALKGPSMMPGGSPHAWETIQPIVEAVSARDFSDGPCVTHIGANGAGHYVKMVHNGIEYGDMQLICEAYSLLKHGAGLSNNDLAEVFDTWNHGELDSYLIEITRDIFTVKDPETGDFMVDRILDKAGAKGTGKWMSQLALDLGVPSTLVTEAVYARCLSALKDARVRASTVLSGPDLNTHDDPLTFIEQVRQALYASKIASYAQGYVQLAAAAKEHNWSLNYGNIAMMWRGGCIIRAQFLERIYEAYQNQPDLENLMLAPYFKKALGDAQKSWRHVVASAATIGIPVPAFMTALAYYDGYRHANLPANLLQAQRDYFGAHTYERIDQSGTFHTEWLELRRPVETSSKENT